MTVLQSYDRCSTYALLGNNVVNKFNCVRVILLKLPDTTTFENVVILR